MILTRFILLIIVLFQTAASEQDDEVLVENTPFITKDEFLLAEVAMYGTEEQYLEAKSFLEEQETVSEQEVESGRLMRRTLSNEKFCEDTNNGASDRYGDDCTYYDKSDYACVRADSWSDGDFHAKQMCCACGGGARITPIAFPVKIDRYPWEKFAREIVAFFTGSKDWCDCGKKGHLQIKADGAVQNVYPGEGAVIDWGKSVKVVQWKCSEQGGWQRARQNPGVQKWKVAYRHERKGCCSGWWNCGNKFSGRIYWYWG